MESPDFPDGCVVLVTGGSRGIGLAAAERFAAAGVRIALLSRDGGQCRAQADRIAARTGVACIGVACDVRLPGEVVSAVRAVHREFGRLDVLVNNAGVLGDARLGMVPAELMREAFDTNAVGSAQMTQAASRLLLRSPAGAIVNVTSIVGIDGNAGQVVYAASKAAMIGLTRAAAKELGLGGVRVNAVAPGLIETRMTEHLTEAARRALEERILLRRSGSPADVADVIVFLASARARYVTGQVLRVDGGLVV